MGRRARTVGRLSAHVAFLRGVNVGKARKLPMAGLRSALEREGFRCVRTHLQSGNVVFSEQPRDCVDAADRITAAIAERFGLDVDVLVLDCDELAGIVEENPLLAEESVPDESLHVVLLFREVTPAEFGSLSLPTSDGERAVLGDGAIYLSLPNGMGRTKLSGGYFERALGQRVTARNWRTVQALTVMCSDAKSETA